MHVMTASITDKTVSWVPSDDTFGMRISMVRHRMDWNSKEAAIACGFSPGAWREWEVFERQPRNLVEVAERIAERTGVDHYWLLTGRSQGDHPTAPACGRVPAGWAPRGSNPEPTDYPLPALQLVA